MFRSRGDRGGRGRGRGRGRGNIAPRKRATFTASRLEDSEDISDASIDDMGNVEDQPPSNMETDNSGSEASDEDVPNSISYQALLQALNGGANSQGPARKKRKIEEAFFNGGKETGKTGKDTIDEKVDRSREHVPDPTKEKKFDDGHETDESDGDVSNEDEKLTDPFQEHYGNVDEADLTKWIKAIDDKKRQSTAITLPGDMRKTFILLPRSLSTSLKLDASLLKQKLVPPGKILMQNLTTTERDLADCLFSYQDVCFGGQSTQNALRLQGLATLHSLNHVFKTRDRVIKNNAKLAQHTDSDVPDIRDQGFTRPKVLILLPTRQSCVQWVERITQLSDPEQQENKSRFLDAFSAPSDSSWESKPADFRALFAGNNDDDFRIGLKFTRKTLKLFSSFYNSDIILASALGLKQAIDGNKDKKIKPEFDFLSSIEIAIIDNTTAIQMQNWTHVESIFASLNHLPTESHNSDFSRCRPWYLDGHAKYLRQTIILASFLTPEINSLISTHTSNIAGCVKYTPIYRGAMLELPNSILHGTLTQTFHRFTSPSPSSDSDARFAFFTMTILPSLLKSNANTKGTLIFIPTYASFLRLRNHLSSLPSVSFAAVSEYTSAPDLSRARSHFLSGRHSVLLYTERVHHFRRLVIRGVRQVVFWGVPENAGFWGEIVGFLGQDGEGKGKVRAVFSRWDLMKLERIVGTERVGKLLNEKGGDMFEFVQ